MENTHSVPKKVNVFSLSLNFYLSMDGHYDYAMDYMANVAKVITRKYPALLVHKKSEDKIKTFLSRTITEKIERLCDSHVSNLCIAEVIEISDMVAEYPEGVSGAGGSSAGASLPRNNPSFGDSGLELSMAVDTGSSDIQPVAFTKPAGDSVGAVRPSVKPTIMKRMVLRVSATLDIAIETRFYLYLIQELPELFGLKELELLRVRLTWQHMGTRFLEEPDPIEIKIVENRTYSRWFIGFLSLIILCFAGITSLFFVIPNLYKQDIHFMRSDTIQQNVSIHNSRVDLENVTLNNGAKDTLIVIDKKSIRVK